MRVPTPVAAAAGLVGAASGLRSMIGLAAVAASGPAAPGPVPRPVALLAGRPVRVATAAAALGELVADKLPRTPSRLGAAGLVPRFALGALAAAALATRSLPDAGATGDSGDDRGGPQPRTAVPAATLCVTAAVGGGTAVAAAFAGAWWRQQVQQSGLPDWPAALLEDSVAAALAWSACALAAAGGPAAG